MKTIQLILKQWKAEVNIRGVIQFSFNHGSGILYIYTHEIQKLMKCENKYTDVLKNNIPGFTQIVFVNTAYYWA